MVVSYPASDFTWTDRVDGVDDVMASDPNVLAGEVNAIEADLVGTGVAGGLKTSAYGSLSARLAVDVNQIVPQIVNLKIAKNADANKLDIFAKSTGLAPATANPIKVMIPDGTGATLRTRSGAVASGTSQIVLADAQAYWGYPTLASSSYPIYVYAIYSSADAGIIWAVSANPNLKAVTTTTTVTDFSYLLLEGSSTYTRQATDYCIRVGSFRAEYHTADTPDYTIDSASLEVRYGSIESDVTGNPTSATNYLDIGNYRIQWGITAITSTAGSQTVFTVANQYMVYGTITFALPFADTNYTLCVNQNNGYPNTPATGVIIVTKAVGTCDVRAYESPNQNMQVEWIAIGRRV